MDLNRSAFLHCPCYCEENVWHLNRHPSIGTVERYVVFISNAQRSVALCHQRAATFAPCVLWDYHVVLLVRNQNWDVLDLDTTLAFPVPARDYLLSTFLPVFQGEGPPLFRLIPAGDFDSGFSSDRRHMQREDGSFHSPPPPWPCITQNGTAFNLWDFLPQGQQDLLTLEAMLDCFGD